ncbi:MAG: fibrobacter succinogenes major paralogous domain-containing protein [Bacteroidaceae bacterium]|nr:fibrobacter succinogenes major paralogous domain-containing protein [Bacteroidaceae bacterium]
MKKTLFAFMALVTAFAATSCQSDEEPTQQLRSVTLGKAYATGPDCEVNWVQLWENGPKFAEYNVGATSATEHGGLYTWGGTYLNGQGGQWKDDHQTGSTALSGTSDTATNLWGDNWRMPTQAELEPLLDSAVCDMEWTTVGGVNGYKFTGKGAFASNSVFLPAGGYCDCGGVGSRNYYGYYWSSTPDGNDNSCCMYFKSGNYFVFNGYRDVGYSVRAVLAE